MNNNEMNGHGEKYSRLKEIALAALLSSKTLEEAAQKSDISVSTLRRWLKNPDFRKDYEEERRHILEMATSGLSEAAAHAIRVLRNQIIGPLGDARDHMAAANAILNVYSKEMQRYDTQRRLSSLEQKMADKQPRNTEEVIDESQFCADDVKDADTSRSLPKRPILVTEATVTIPPTQMSVDGREKKCDGSDSEDLNHENTAVSYSLLKRRIL